MASLLKFCVVVRLAEEVALAWLADRVEAERSWALLLMSSLNWLALEVEMDEAGSRRYHFSTGWLLSIEATGMVT